MKLLDIVERVVDEKLADIILPKCERQSASAPVLVGEVQAVIIVSEVLGAIPVIDAVIVELALNRESAGVVIHYVQCYRDTVDVAQIDESLQLSWPGHNVRQTDRSKAFGGQQAISSAQI